MRLLVYVMAIVFQLFCDYCGWKRLSDGKDLSDLTEVNLCSTCSGGRRFKCPRCGRVAKIRKLDYPQVKSSDDANAS